jgi:prepilin signal peptidase PulO-like enzyme (type II secretory pathway)
MLTFIIVALVLFGLILGSFAGASVWRLRARQLQIDKREKEPYDKAEYARLKPLMSRSTRTDRSMCLECEYALKWYDLIPLVSWIALKGKCRSCRRPIGFFEPLMELGVTLVFILSFVFWPVSLETPLAIAQFTVWLTAVVGLAILVAYDAKWFLLPDKVTFAVAGLALVWLVLRVIEQGEVWGPLLSTIGAVGVLSGLYLLIYLISKGRWVGFGDVKLGLALGLIIGDWALALLALFLANLIGTLIVLPLLATGKLKRDSRVPFGPFLIAGTSISLFFGWYGVELLLFAVN